MTEERSLVELLLAKQLEFYRLQRHDLLNHWQVVMGYLQLEMPDKALAYMKNSLKNLEVEQSVGQIPEETVSAILLNLIVPLRRDGLEVLIELDANLKSEEYWDKNWRQEYGLIFDGYTRNCLPQIYALRTNLKDLQLQIKLNALERFACHLQVLDQGQVIWESWTACPLEGE